MKNSNIIYDAKNFIEANQGLAGITSLTHTNKNFSITNGKTNPITMSEIILTSKILGAKEKAGTLNNATVKTGRVFVGAAEYDETDYTEAQDVEVGVFMDGTWNNRSNTDARKEYEKLQDGNTKDVDMKLAAKYLNDDIKSFESEYSNIARMEPYYKEEGMKKR